MKALRLTLTSVSFVVLSAVAWASTFLNTTYTNNGQNGNVDTLTLTPNGGGTITLPSSTVITVVDENGVALNPQPALSVNWTLGETHEQWVIHLTSSTFPKGGGVKFSRIDTSDQNRVPVGNFSDQ